MFVLSILVLSMTNVCFAKELDFTKVFVDSNQYTSVKSGTKDITNTTADLNVENIYTSSGGTSNYKQVKAKIMSSGTETIADKGATTSLPIPSRYQSAGSRVTLYCMGNNPALDCKISGYVDIH